MSHDPNVPCQATPSGDLEFQIVSSTVPKNEREWWAHHEIKRLRAMLSVAKDEAEAQYVLRCQQRERAEKAEAEIERLKEWQRQMVEKAAEKSLDGYRELAARLAQRDEEIERLESALHQIKTWCAAYPIRVFPEVENWGRVDEVLAAAGLSLTQVSASNMRHVVNGITKIIDGVRL
jgi:uncharacterized small protein (DUF1192 family)